jgi:predicted alpha/beta-hydrolase family hydrolase
MSDVVEFETPAGIAGVLWEAPRGARGLLTLGHGAGGGVDARDIVAVGKAAVQAGFAVARIIQPYRMAGRRAPAPAPQLDTALGAVVPQLIAKHRSLRGKPLILGGRSSGARVACRTAATVRASGVLALAFPLHPPGKPEKSRAEELLAVEVPVLVVQGERDPFGSPDELRAVGLGPEIQLHVAPAADHGLKVAKGQPPVLPDIVTAVTTWLEGR